MLDERKLIIGLTVLALLCGLAVIVMAANQQDTHTLTIGVLGVNDIDVIDIALTLTISGIDTAVTTTTTVNYSTNVNSRKITVSLDSAYSSGITLTVAASGTTGGGTNGSGTLSSGGVATAVDVITGISKTSGSRTVTYTGTANASVGDVNETRTVTFTLAQQ